MAKTTAPKKRGKRPKTVVVILSGGSGDRFGSDVPKQFISLNGAPILSRTVERFLNHPRVNDVIIVSHQNWISRTKELFPDLRIVVGGGTRQESSKRGVLACPEDTEYVLIHDAVRPLVFSDVIDRCIEALDRGEVAVTTVITSADTITQIDGHKVANMPDRSVLRRSQTPQAFRYDVIKEAHLKTSTTESTDDVRLVFELGYPCSTVEGDTLNMKVTTIADLYTIERLAQLEKPKVLESFDFTGKHAIVFGGTSGIGKATADLLEQSGAEVVRCGRKECDVRDIGAIERIFESQDKVDIVVNSAGILIPHMIADATSEDINNVFETNVIAAINICRIAVRYMKSGGHIVNIGSSSAYRGRSGFATYSASKAALANFSQAAAEEFAEYGIHVNVVSPPRAATRLYFNLNPGADPSKLFDPADAAKVICSYCTGPESGNVVDLKIHMTVYGTGAEV